MTMLWEIVRFVLLKIENFREKIAFQLALLENKGKPVTRIIQGSRMKIDLTDPGISRELLIDKIREESSTKESIKKMKKGMVIADIGANLGYYTLMEAKHIGTGGKVYAFEPVPANVKLLMESIELNNYKNVEIVEKAAGEKEVMADYKKNVILKTYNSANIYFPKWSKEFAVQKTEDFVKNNIYFNVLPIDFIVNPLFSNKDKFKGEISQRYRKVLENRQSYTDSLTNFIKKHNINKRNIESKIIDSSPNLRTALGKVYINTWRDLNIVKSKIVSGNL